MGYIAVGPNGELALPPDLREQLGVKPGDRIELVLRDESPATHEVGPASLLDLVTVEAPQRRILTIDGQTVDLWLDSSSWEALHEIAGREHLSVNHLCTMIKGRLDEQSSPDGSAGQDEEMLLASAIRVFVAAYYRRAVAVGVPRGSDEGGSALRPRPQEAGSEKRIDVVRRGAGPEKPFRLNDLIGIGGTAGKPIAQDEIDAAIRMRAARRVLNQ